MSKTYFQQHLDSNKQEIIDCSLTSNFDENYLKIYPAIPKNKIVFLVAKYPDHSHRQIKEKIVSFFNLKRDFVLGSGSEDLIIRINRYIFENKLSVGLVVPIFFRITETLNNSKTSIITESKFLKGKWNKKVDVIWFENPNMFSGKTYDRSTLLKIINFHKNCLFIIDEAGIFSLENWQRYSFLSVCDSMENVVVLSSFSKLFGISGLRAAFASGTPKIITSLKQNCLTFPFSSVTEYFLNSILNYPDFTERLRRRILNHRKDLENLLLKVKGIEILATNTNCIFFKHSNLSVYKVLKKAGIITLNLNKHISRRGFVRMTAHSSPKIHRELKKKISKIFGVPA